MTKRIMVCADEAKTPETEACALDAGLHLVEFGSWKLVDVLPAVEAADVILIREPLHEAGFIAGYAASRGKTLIIVGTTGCLCTTEAAYRVDYEDDLRGVLRAIAEPPSCACATFSECSHK